MIGIRHSSRRRITVLDSRERTLHCSQQVFRFPDDDGILLYNYNDPHNKRIPRIPWFY